jgi:osmotically inducible protein OsmC
MIKRNGSAYWEGGLLDGKGTVSTASGVLSKTQYSFKTRFENGIGTNPEELIAAAHAGCFSMALSKQLEDAGMKAQSIETTATVQFDKVDGGFAVVGIHLDLTAKIPGGDNAKFQMAAEGAKAGCPISKLFKNNTNVTLDAKLVS